MSTVILPEINFSTYFRSYCRSDIKRCMTRLDTSYPLELRPSFSPPLLSPPKSSCKIYRSRLYHCRHFDYLWANRRRPRLYFRVAINWIGILAISTKLDSILISSAASAVRARVCSRSFNLRADSAARHRKNIVAPRCRKFAGSQTRVAARSLSQNFVLLFQLCLLSSRRGGKPSNSRRITISQRGGAFTRPRGSLLVTSTLARLCC